MRDLIGWIRSSKFIIEMKCDIGSVKPIVKLLPFVSDASMKFNCSLSFFCGNPVVEFDPIIKYLVDQRHSLRISSSKPHTIPAKRSATSSVEEELLRARICALDFSLVSSLQDDLSASIRSGNIRMYRTNVSKYRDSFSVSFLKVSGDSGAPKEVNFSLSPVDESEPPVLKRIRDAYIDFSGGLIQKSAFYDVLLECV
jgi:hypothetical protein